MADTTKLEQMLEKLVNNDRDGADQLFHEFVIEKSRSIYEKMIESDLEDLEVDESTDEEVDETTDEEVDESTDDEDLDEASDEEVDESEEEVDENFEEFTPEADPMGGEPATDMLNDIEADGEDDGEMDMGDEDGEEEIEDRVVDLEDALDDLKAEFEKMMSGDEGGEEADDEDDMDMDDDEEGDEEAEEESYDPSTLGMPAYEGKKSQAEQMREYVEKVAEPKGEDNKAKSPVAGKNDMGGTTANIAKGSAEEKGGSVSDPAVDSLGKRQVNVSGNKKAPAMSNAKGHGAEKKGAGETGTNSKSTIGS